jgi:hypothetical protein
VGKSEIGMLVGHLGAGLAAKSAAPKVRLGTLFAAAILLDIVLWLFVILRLEGVVVPPDFETRHALAFNFPWSHSLAGALVWSAAAACAWAWTKGGGRIFAFAPAVIAATVLSHWLLDFLVHPAEMPLWGPGAPSVGLGIGQPLALYVELAVAAAGLVLFLLRVPLSMTRRVVVAGVVLLAAGLTVFGAYSTVPPPDSMTLAAISLLVIFIIVTAAAVADRAPQ